jgi:hypothetical protein
MTIKVTGGAATGKGPKWKALTERFYRNVTLTASNAKIRNEIIKKQKGLITNLGGFLDALADAGSSALTAPVHDEGRGAQIAGKSTAAGGQLLQAGYFAKAEHVRQAVKELSTEAGLDTKYEVDHVNVTPLGIKITSLIDVVESLRDDVISGGDTGRTTAVGQTLTKMAVSGNQNEIARELETRLQKLRTARAYLKELEPSIRRGETPTEKDLGQLVAKNAKGGSYSIRADKATDISVYEEGGMLGSFQIIDEDVHQKKTEYQSNMSYVLNDIMTGQFNLPIMTDEKLDEINALRKSIEQNPTTIVGSEGIENAINRQLVEVFKGKKPKPSKSKTTRRKKVKSKMDLRKTKAGLAKLKAKKRKAKQLLALAAKRDAVKRKVSRGSGDQAKAALHLKRLINRRLSAEVRRNMGRPALINRTGRFSNSVKLESLVPSPAGMVGKYSYLYRPYETFENTGAKKWPLGYNPKPLITKSIRNLAVQHMETKLTLRRT